MLIIVIIIISSKATRNVRILKIPATQSRREALMQPSLIASTLLTEISSKPRTQNFRISHSARLTHRYPQTYHPFARNSTDSCFQGIGTTTPYHRPSQSYRLPKARTNLRILQLPAKHNLTGMQLTLTYYVNQVWMPPKRQEKQNKKQKPHINPPETYKRFHHDSPVSSSSN